MSLTPELFEEVQPFLNKLSNHLFQNAETFVRNRGNFLPFAAILEKDGKVQGVMAHPGDHTDDLVSSIEVLPALHASVKDMVQRAGLDALAICEHVHLQNANRGQTSAIKVLFEHRQGACIAVYLPFHKVQTGAYEFGPISWKPAQPEIKAW